MEELNDINQKLDQVHTPQEFFDNLDPIDKTNINTIRKLFEETRQDEGIAGFIGVVGSSRLRNSEIAANDIDLLVGLKKDLGDVSKLAPIGVDRKRYQLWKETLDKMLTSLLAQGVKVEEIPIKDSHASPNISDNDGKLVLTFPQGKKIELLCDQNPDSNKEAYDASLPGKAA